MTHDDKPAKEPITVFACGPGELCQDGDPHDSAGPWEPFGMGGDTATCSRCGVSSASLALWYGP